MQHPEVVYVLTGFKQDLGFRVFSYKRTGPESGPTSTVRADLDLARRHGILMQELPLLCREVLEHATAGGDVLSLVYSEDAMLARADARHAQLELAARKKLSKHAAGAPASSFGPSCT